MEQFDKNPTQFSFLSLKQQN